MFQILRFRDIFKRSKGVPHLPVQLQHAPGIILGNDEMPKCKQPMHDIVCAENKHFKTKIYQV